MDQRLILHDPRVLRRISFLSGNLKLYQGVSCESKAIYVILCNPSILCSLYLYDARSNSSILPLLNVMSPTHILFLVLSYTGYFGVLFAGVLNSEIFTSKSFSFGLTSK